MLALCRTHVQVLGKGEQLEVGGGYGVLAVHAGGYGELIVWARPAHEAQCLIRKGQIIVNKFLEFRGLFRRSSGKCGWGGWPFPGSLDMFFFGQNEPLLRGWRAATRRPGPMAAYKLIPAPGYMLGTQDAGETLQDVRADQPQDWFEPGGVVSRAGRKPERLGKKNLRQRCHIAQPY